MSGLVNGLQNRLRRFESARHLAKGEGLHIESFSFFDIQYLCISLYLLFVKYRRTSCSVSQSTHINYHGDEIKTKEKKTPSS